MKMYMIATINLENKLVGFRILDSDTGKIMDVPEQSVLQVLKSGQQIINLEETNNKVQGSNGDINRYAKLCNGALQGAKLGPVVVLNQIGENGYTISDHNGKIVKAKMVDVLNYAKNNGIANGKISTRNQTEFISAISGTYEKIEVPPMMISTDNATVIIKPKEEITRPELTETKQEISLVLSDIQKSVLKDYYSWAGLDNETANSEIECLNKIVDKNRLEEAYSDTKLLYEILTKLGSSYTIAEAFGNELATKLVNFMSVKLPFTKSLVEKCAKYTSENMEDFYKVLFSDMTDGVITIIKSEKDTLSLAAKLYLEYMATREILGVYKGYEIEADSYNKQFIKKYVLATKYTFTELRAVIGAVDVIVNFGAEVNTIFNQLFLKDHKSELFYLSILQYKDCEYEKITDDEKMALMVTLGYNSEYYNKEAAYKLNEHVSIPDKIFGESPHKKYKECLFESSPIGNLKVYIPIETNIEELYYRQIQALNRGQDVIMRAFYEFCIRYIRKVESKQRDMLQEELRIKNEEAERQRRIDREKQRLADEEKMRQEEEINRAAKAKLEEERIAQEKLNQSLPTTQQASESKLHDDIINNRDLSLYDRVDLYKELKTMYKGDTTEICFKISDDMISRNLKFSDMSKKQQFRLNEAIDKMVANKDKSAVKPSQSNGSLKDNNSKQEKTTAETEENKTYFMNEHPEIKEKVEKLISKADTVEMAAILVKEPFVLKICYSVIKYNKASDKQLKHVNNAIDLLEKQ